MLDGLGKSLLANMCLGLHKTSIMIPRYSLEDCCSMSLIFFFFLAMRYFMSPVLMSQALMGLFELGRTEFALVANKRHPLEQDGGGHP
jgi:hypothetical protein